MKIFVNDQESHNKWWSYETNQNNFDVIVKWGRLGLIGDTQIKNFVSNYDRDDFIDKKTREKLRGGYKEITAEEFEVRTTIANIVGTGSKIDEIKFVKEDKVSGTILIGLRGVTSNELANPTLKPAVYARVVGRKDKKSGKHPITEFLFRVDQSYKIVTSNSERHEFEYYLMAADPIKPGDDCEKLASTVGEVIGRVLV